MKIEYRETIIKTIDASDLPIYTKWHNSIYRLRNVDGRIVGDKLNTFDMEYSQSCIDICLDVEHKRVGVDEWRNAMHKFMNYLKK
jgi:hypothetical protein